ncbi:Protoncoupled amino acid transporter 1like, partial [Caligus rogercresseyi]
MLLIVDAKYLILARRKRAQELPLLPNEESSIEEGFVKSDVGDAAFGHPGRLTIDTSLLISQIGFCCAYLIFITETLSSYFPTVSKSEWLFLSLPPLFCLTLIRDLSRLAPFSLIGQIFNFLAFAGTNIEGVLPLRIPLLLCRAGMILSLENSVDDSYKPHFRKTFVKTIAFVTFIYISFGASGYLSYGPETKDIITLNLPHIEGSIDFATLVKL